MRNIKILVIFLIVIYVVTLLQRGFFNASNKAKTAPPKKIIFPTVSAVPTPTHATSQTRNLSHPNTPTPTPAVQSQTISGDFVYPGSTKISGDNNNLILSSTQDPNTITNWYKDKITSSGANAKSFVTTNTNGNALNKLVGAGSSFRISVEISRQSGDTTTKISVSLQ